MSTRRHIASVARPRLVAALERGLPDPLAAVLLPAVRWRINRRTVTALVPNQVWEELFRDHALPILEAQRFPQVEAFKVVRRLTGDDATAFRQQRLNNLLSDPGNEFPRSAARQILESPGLTHNPLFLHGPSGCGKTHLLNAIANEFRDLLGNEAVHQLTGEDWINQQTQADDDDDAATRAAASAAVITCDDLNRLAERDVAQEQFFHLLNEGLEQGQQFILAAPMPPKQLSGFAERLVSRFSWGLAAGIDAPKLETRVALLRELAGPVIEDMDHAELGELVENLAPDMHLVMQLADRLLSGQKVRLGEDKASFDRVLEVVAANYQLRPGDLAGKRRHRAVAQARQTALLLCRRLTGHSLEALGSMVGGRDHSTVLYSIRQAEQRQQEDPVFRRLLNELTQEILT